MTKRILIVDDEPDILEALNIILEDEGYTIILSNTGEAVNYIEIIQPDLLLLDIRINGNKKRGDEICYMLKNQKYKLPIILISAESNIAMLAGNCGADAFIQKPFDVQTLVNCVKDFLD
jgi:two-component system, OmpR family, response regulator VicR